MSDTNNTTTPNQRDLDTLRALVNENNYLRQLMTDSSVRLATASVSQIGPPILIDPFARNQFVTDLYNKIITTKVRDRIFTNPLSVLKGDKLYPYGDMVEHMIANPAVAIEYDNTDDNILTTAKPDFKVEYIKVNRKDKYRVSVPYPVLQQAFSSESGFSEFLSATINTLYNGDYIDEFLLMKKIVSDMCDGGYIKKVQNATGGDATTIQIIDIFDYMQFPSTNWNGYTLLNPDKPLTTFCPANELAIIADAHFINQLSVETLAAKFNLDEINLTKNIIKVDGFEGTSGILAVIIDHGFMQVHDTLYELDSFHRADNLTEKSYLHHWQTMQGSLLANACCIVDHIDEP